MSTGYGQFPHEWVRYSLLTPPAVLPVTVADAKAQLRLETTTDDAFITTLIKVATTHVEQVTGRSLCKQKWRFSIGHFWSLVSPLDQLWWYRRRFVLDLGKPPLMSIDAMSWVGLDGAANTIDPSLYTMQSSDTEALVMPLDIGTFWPIEINPYREFIVDFYSGYTDGVVGGNPAVDGDPAGKIPAPLKHAVLMLVNDLYENREQTVIGQGAAYRLPFGVDNLLAPYRVVNI